VNIVNGLYYYIWTLDCLIGSLCCYLNFKMNDRLYYKLCGCFNVKLRKLCGNISKNKMIKTKIDDRADMLHQYLLNDGKKNSNVKKY